jgi:threonyl-tRNA synthetase
MNQENIENSPEYRIKHSAEHVFAQAISELYPGKIKLAVAHISEEGFANDASWEIKISEEMFPEIEKKMKEIIKKNLPIVEKEITLEEARELFKDNPFKLEWVEQFAAEDKKLTVYWTGEEYVDLCKGPHVRRTGEIGAFKLISVAGAYWRGDEKNEMLSRVYGVAFKTKAQLDEYLLRQEEARKRDHRTIGKDLDLFVFSDVVGKGLPLWTPKGAAVRRELERFIVDEEIKRGYLHVYTPDIAKLDLYQKSGHYPYYKDSMYAPITIDEEQFMLRPMTCPHHFELYLSQQRSYKELPMKIAELAKLYRYEKSGELTGLIRVRSFCLADAHIVARKEQAKQQIHEALDLIEYIMGIFGLKPVENYRFRLSLGDRGDNTKYYKDDAAWDFAEGVLREVLVSKNAPFYEGENEAAFYGPKIDIQMKNVNGKEDTAFTVQYDFVMPKRFNLTFINEQSQEEEPIVIHRSSIGAIERVVGFLIEHFSGNFPLWLHPDQVVVVPIGLEQQEFAQKVKEELLKENPGLRISVDDSNNTLGRKIMVAQQKKIPYIAVIGKKEAENSSVNIRLRSNENLGEMSISEFAARIKEKIASKALDL